MHMNPSTIGKNLSTARNRAGISQQELGQLTGVDQTYVSRTELGKKKFADPEWLARAAIVLRCDIRELLLGEQESA